MSNESEQGPTHELFEREKKEASSSRYERAGKQIEVLVLSPLRILWSDPRTRIAGFLLTIYALMGIAGYYRILGTTSLNQAPPLVQPFTTLAYPLGTTSLGQDLLVLIVNSTPAMLQMIIAGGIFTTMVATIVGVTAGYRPYTRVDQVLMYLTDIMLTIPGLPLVIVVAIIFEPRNPAIVGILLAINNWAGLARSLRSEVMSIRDNEYIEASAAMGIGTPTILAKDLLPNVMSYVLINFARSSRRIIFESTALYYLGVLPVTSLNWGVILNNAPRIALRDPEVRHWILIPLLTVIGISAAFTLFAQGADRLFNPRIRAQHEETESEPEAAESY